MSGLRVVGCSGPLALALALALHDGGAVAQEGVAEAIGARTVECHQTEAGGRQCQLRNDEAGLPALEQARLLSLTLHNGNNEAEGLVRIADLDLPPRLEVELAFGDVVVTIEGVGRRGRLTARLLLRRHELRGLVAAAEIAMRFADGQGQPHELVLPTAGIAEALALAEGFL